MPDRTELELLYNAAREIERRRRAAPLLYYKPHPKQEKFHSLGKRRRLLLGGNRSGKTFCGAHETVAHMYGYYFWRVPNLQLKGGDLPPREEVPIEYWVRRHDKIPVRVPSIGMGISGLPRVRGIGQTMHPAIFSILPEEVRRKTHVMKGQGGVPDWFELPNGSKILYATDEQALETFEGFVLDFLWNDEPIQQSIYSALMARLHDYQGSVWSTLTPIHAKVMWMYHSLYVNTPDDAGVLEMSMSDNAVNTPEMIEAFRKSGEYSERELSSRLHGTFEALGNRCIPDFNPEVHIVRGFTPPKNWVHGMCVDPHHKRPAFMVWWAYNPESRCYHFWKEWPTQDFFKMKDGGLSPQDYAALIRNIEADSPRVRIRLCDPRFGRAEHQRHGYTETCWIDQMARYGLGFDVPRNTHNLDYGHQKITELLRYDKKFPISPSNHPRLVVHEHLANVSAAFLNYSFEDSPDNKAPYTKVDERWKDPVDVVRYTVLYDLPASDEEVSALQRFSEKDLREANDY